MKHSFWEVEQYFTDVDYAIVGSGIVGLCTALKLKAMHPLAKIIILERGYLPAGASSKNAGFACFGSPTELIDDLTKMSKEEVFELVLRRKKGLEQLISICGENQIDYQVNGSYEVFTPSELNSFNECLAQLNDLNHLLKPIFKTNVYELADDRITDFGFKQVNHLIKNKFEGQIDTGKMITRLIALANEKGIQILNGVEVKDFSDCGKYCEVNLANGFVFKSEYLCIATNGFAKALLPELQISPARAQVLITKPIENLRVNGIFHLEKGYYYFRNIGNRLLLGGGRNLAFETETTTHLETTFLIQEKLKFILESTIIPDIVFEIEHNWAGIMGVGETKIPIVKQVSSRTFCGVKMGGMGIAIGASIGTELANLISDI